MLRYILHVYGQKFEVIKGLEAVNVVFCHWVHVILIKGLGLGIGLGLVPLSLSNSISSTFLTFLFCNSQRKHEFHHIRHNYNCSITLKVSAIWMIDCVNNLSNMKSMYLHVSEGCSSILYCITAIWYRQGQYIHRRGGAICLWQDGVETYGNADWGILESQTDARSKFKRWFLMIAELRFITYFVCRS